MSEVKSAGGSTNKILLTYKGDYRDGGSKSWWDQNGVEYVQSYAFYKSLDSEGQGVWYTDFRSDNPVPVPDEVVKRFIFQVNAGKR